jgi:hypothetical protein
MWVTPPRSHKSSPLPTAGDHTLTYTAETREIADPSDSKVVNEDKYCKSWGKY